MPQAEPTPTNMWLFNDWGIKTHNKIIIIENLKQFLYVRLREKLNQNLVAFSCLRFGGHFYLNLCDS